MTDIAVAAAQPPPDSFTSTNSDRSHNSGGLLAPPGRSVPEGSPARSNDDARASSAEEEKRGGGAHDEAAGGGRPSATVSGSSSVSGGNGGGGHTLPPSFAPFTAKKGPQSFFSGSKIKHLKKADGIPLWRADIQYEFLRAVFYNTDPVFTNVYDDKKGYCFADIYIDAMARSSKTSKILRDKLLTERENALNMAMVCLLVNVGRMNTTLNCEFPRFIFPNFFFFFFFF
jgi:Ino eighty subunit 1